MDVRPDAPAAPSRAAMPPREWLAVSALALALLVVLRPVTLATPYWWDAAAVYVPGAKWLVEHGFAARPGVFPSDLSRGHTPLFYLILAAGFRLFGAGPVVGHAIALGFSVVALAVTYALGRLLGGRPTGLAAMLLLAVSPLYLTMSSEALPEIAVTAVTALGAYAFARGRYARCAAWGCVLVGLKELSVFGPLAAAGALLLDGLRRRELRAIARPFAVLCVPLVPLVGFFAWQRLAEGWFITPYHAQLFSEPHSYRDSFVSVAGSMFVADGRWIALLVAPVAWLAWGRRGNGTPHGATRVAEPPGAPARGVVLLSLALLVLANVAFYTYGWSLERYMLPAHPAICIALALPFGATAFHRAHRTRLAALGAVLLACAAVALARREAGAGYASGETTFRYAHAIRAQQALFRALEAARSPDGARPVVLTTWPMSDELRHPYLGWVARPFRVVNADYADLDAPGTAFDAVVAFDGVGSYRRLREIAQARGMRLVQRAQVGGAGVEWWGR